MNIKLVKGTKKDFDLAKSLLRKIKKEPALIFEEKLKKNGLIRFDLIKYNTHIMGVFISVEFSGEFINYLSLEENINDEIIFKEIYQNIRALQQLNPEAESCFNFQLSNSFAIDFFQKKEILRNDASGYEMSISIADINLFCDSRNVISQAYDDKKIDSYIEIENKAFAKLIIGRESIPQPAKHKYADYLKTRNEKKQFGAYELNNNIIGIIYMGNDYTIETLAVHPSFQGRGFGKLIVFDWLSRYSKYYPEIAEIKLHVDEKNTSALKFYKKIGFKLTGSYSENTLLR